ncbi:MAG: sigma-54 dependent transcriptional regulator [Kangiellaceae bacterium]|nr:sigma-54 dependent transcriptional regulator [Kangiellaceae bacterium]
MPEPQSLLLIDDNAYRAGVFKAILEFLGFNCVPSSSENWLAEIQSNEEFAGVIIGQLNKYDFDNTIGRSIYDEIANIDKQLPIVLIYDPLYEESDDDFDREQLVGTINWPLKQNELLEVLHACSACRSGTTNPELIRRSNLLLHKIVGQSDAMSNARKLIEQVASSEATVLILGESGTGKEIAARGLHDLSDRANNPFVPINCGAIPAELLESELFGHEKGAFTGALVTRKGRFELADGGTIFLDEIGDMPMPMQVKLLRVLQDKTFERVGSEKSITANVRIVAATHRQLSSEVKEGRFREDLFYRLNVFPIEMPSLRDRVEDVDQLVAELISRLEKEKRGSVRLSPNAIRSLMACQWPGNVRELANLLERLCILHPYGVVDVKDLPEEYRKDNDLSSYQTPALAKRGETSSNDLNIDKLIASVATFNGSDTSQLPTNGLNLKEFIKDVEVSYIEKALTEEDWVVARAAKRLTMQRTTLVEKMRKYQLQKS